jgi:hypothetical protein
MAPSTGNRVGIISLSPIRGRITRAGKVFLLKFFWLKGEGTKKKSRQPSTLYVVFLTKAAPIDQGGGKRRANTKGNAAISWRVSVQSSERHEGEQRKSKRER